MTYASIGEYGEAMRKRYLSASKKEKGKLLTEFCTVTKYHRKAAVRLLCDTPSKTRCRGRERQYGLPVSHALRRLWEVSDHLCSKRLAPFIPELVDSLERHGELSLDPEVKEQVLRVSASTIDRLLGPYRRRGCGILAAPTVLLPASRLISRYAPSVSGKMSIQALYRLIWCFTVVKAPRVLCNHSYGSGCCHRMACMRTSLGQG